MANREDEVRVMAEHLLETSGKTTSRDQVAVYTTRLLRHFLQWRAVHDGRLVEDSWPQAERPTLAELLHGATVYEQLGDSLALAGSTRRETRMEELAAQVGLDASELRVIFKWWADSGRKVATP